MADEKKPDETIPGGIYISTDGQVIDANGKVIPGYSVVDGKVVKDKPAKAAKTEEPKTP